MKTIRLLSILLCALFWAAQSVTGQDDTRNKLQIMADDGNLEVNADEVSVVRFDGGRVTLVQPWGSTVFDHTLRQLTFLRPLPGTLRLTACVGVGSADTRALGIDDSGALKSTWEEGDKVYVYADADGTASIGTLMPQTYGGKTAMLSGDIDSEGLSTGSTLYLSTVERTHGFASQAGTLDGLFYATAESQVTIEGGNASLAGTSFTSPMAIVAVTMKNGSDTTVDVTKVVVSGGSDDITVNLAQAAPTFYVAVPEAASTTYTFTATTSDSKTRTGSKTAEIVAGKYYTTSVTVKGAGTISFDESAISKFYGDAAFTNDLSNDGDGAVTYASSNTSVATVDENSGEVTIVGVGETTITATVADGADYSYATNTATYTVTVGKAAASVATAPAAKTGLEYSDSPLALVSGGEAENGTIMYYVSTTDSKPGTSAAEWSADVPMQTNAGTYYVWYYVKADANYSDTDVTAIEGNSVTISKAATTTDPVSTMTTQVTAKKNGEEDQPYTGSAITLVSEGVSEAGTLKYIVATGSSPAPDKSDSGWSESVPTVTDAGTYYVWYYAEGNDNYSETAVSSSPIEVTISKTAATKTDPTANTGLTYTGEDQALANAGSSEHGTFTYCDTEDGEFTSTIPTAANAGDNYTVYWKFTADGNHTGDANGSLTDISISKKDVTVSGITAINKTYDGSTTATLDYTGVAFDGKLEDDALSVTATGMFADPGTGTGKTVTISDLTLSGASAANYKLASSGQQTSATANITAAAASVGTAPAAKTGLEYSDSPLALVSDGEAVNGTMMYYVSTTDNKPETSAAEWSADVPTQTKAGTYYVWYYVKADANYSDTDVTAIDGNSVTISKTAASKTDPTKNTGLTYTGAAQVLVNAGSSSHGTFTYCATENGTYSAAIPTGTAAGDSYTVYWKFTADDNHTGSTSGSLTGISINQKEVTVSGITASNKTYDGSTTATLVYSGASFTGKVGSDALSVTATGTFADANAGTGKTVTISGLTLGGTSAANYKLASSGQQTSATANITKKDLTITAQAQTVNYGTDITKTTDKITTSGLASGHNVSAITLTQSTTNVTNSGTITPSAATVKSGSTDVTSNYNITYNTGVLTINKVAGAITCSTDALSFAMSDGKNSTTMKTGVSGMGGTITVSSSDVTNCTVTISNGTITVTRVSTNDWTATITVKLTPDDNHTAPTAVTFTVSADVNTPTNLAELKKFINLGGNSSTYLGYYVTSSGAISTSDANAIGRVAYCSTSAVDTYAGASDTRILVLAVEDVGSNIQWKMQNTADESGYNDYSAMNGLRFCENHKNNNYPAAYQAYNWTKSKPTGATNWFLPSRAQWEAMLTVATKVGTGQITGRYWVATEKNDNVTNDEQWSFVYFYNVSGVSNGWYANLKMTNTNTVRACFAY